MSRRRQFLLATGGQALTGIEISNQVQQIQARDLAVQVAAYAPPDAPIDAQHELALLRWDDDRVHHQVGLDGPDGAAEVETRSRVSTAAAAALALLTQPEPAPAARITGPSDVRSRHQKSSMRTKGEMRGRK